MKLNKRLLPIIGLALLFTFSCKDDDVVVPSAPVTTNPTDTTSKPVDTTNANAADGMLVIDGINYVIEDISVVRLSSGLSINVSTANDAEVLTFMFKNTAFSTVATTYDITAVLPTATKVNVTLNKGSSFYYVEINNPIGQVNSTPDTNDFNRMIVNSMKLVDNAITPTQTLTVSTNFLAKLYAGDYTLSSIGDTYTGSKSSLVEGANNINIVLTSTNQNNRTGSLSIYLPKNAAAGMYTIIAGQATDWLNPSNGVVHINAITNPTGGQQLNNLAQSGTATLAIRGNEYAVTFSNLPTDNGFKTDVLSGAVAAVKK